MRDEPGAIVAQRLKKLYGTRHAVHDVSLTVRHGEIFGVLGPNGAGKTTVIEILQGLRQPTDGCASVLGLDVSRQSKQIRRRVGTCLQETRLPPRLRVIEVVNLLASVYGAVSDQSSVLRQFGLWELRRSYCGQLSKGEMQRLAVALAFVGEPELVFLDEASAGLDAHARQALHDTIRQFRGARRTVVLTTHYLEEAASLCDRVAILNRGRILALGTVSELRAQISPAVSVRVRWTPHCRSFSLTTSGDGFEPEMDTDGQGLRISTYESGRTVAAIVRRCDELGLELTDVEITGASLGEVFMKALVIGDTPQRQ